MTNMMTRKFLLVAGIVLAVVAIMVIGSAGWFFHAVYSDRSFPAVDTRVVIPRGSTFGEIASELAEKGVIGNALAFRILGKMRHADTDAHAGEYRFVARQTQSEVLQQLTSGGAQIAVWVTIPEGFTAAQIAQRLQEQQIGSASSYDACFKQRHIVVDGQPTKSLEGFLFPSTYLIPTDASPDQVATLLTNQFFVELPKDAVTRAKALRFTIPQIITIASLIEREAKADDERAIMAGVYYNRLRIGMPLEVDATIEYALPVYKTELSYADLRVDSPYNSYTHTGLPPTPIANPGEPSIEAAFHPVHTAYLYYVYKGNGHHAFAKTLEEHNANVAKYLK